MKMNLEINSQGTVRLVCAGFCRIRNSTGHYLLALSKSQLKYNNLIYRSIGGALEYYVDNLPKQFDALPEDETKRELRWEIPIANIESFKAWFYERRQRETTPFRELKEELVEEMRVLGELDPQDVSMSFNGTHEVSRVSDRFDTKRIYTYYIIEVFNVSFDDPKTKELLNALSSQNINKVIYWATSDEINKNKTQGGIPVDASIVL